LSKKEDIELDIVGNDGVSEIILRDTNGYTPYINIKWVIGGVITVLTAIAAWIVV
jgi:hypothetical protein